MTWEGEQGITGRAALHDMRLDESPPDAGAPFAAPACVGAPFAAAASVSAPFAAAAATGVPFAAVPTDGVLATVPFAGPSPDEGDDDETVRPPRPTVSALSEGIRERLFKSRTLIISGEVTQRLAADVMGQLLAMSADSDAPITIFINSQGGHVESGDTIHDIIRFIKAPVRMIGTGWVASAGALIYVAVPLEQRFSLPNTRFLLHQPAGGARGTASDVEIEAREILKMRERLNRVFAERTGQSIERIEDDTRRNFWLDANAALDYGLVGRIVRNVTELD